MKKQIIGKLFPVSIIFLISISALSQTASSFELRYISKDPQANGITDFKGETGVFNTPQRVEFLKHYADVAKDFFDDPKLDTKVVTPKEVSTTVQNIKPQPLPEIRNSMPLNDWRYLGYKSGQHQQDKVKIKKWNNTPGVSVKNDMLVFNEDAAIDFEFPMQSWRYTLEWKVKVPANDKQVSFCFTERGKIKGATVGFGRNGKLFYYTADNKKVESIAYNAGQWYSFKIEFDMAAWKRGKDVLRYNLYVDGKRIADYVPMQRVVKKAGVGYAKNFTSMAGVNKMTVIAPKGTSIDDIWGVGYHYTGRESYPYNVATFLDEDFEVKPTVNGWDEPGYCDSGWAKGSFPIVHGSERHAGEDLHMRTKVKTGSFDKAFLNIETIDPGGEVWINGKVAAVVTNRHPQKIDVTEFIEPGRVNLIAVKVNHFYLTEEVGEIMPHSSLDLNIGWFAGRMSLDLVNHQHIDDVFVYTTDIAEEAKLKAKISFNNQHWLSFRGKAAIKLFPWYPEESATPAFETEIPVVLTVGEQTIEHEFFVASPKLWTPEDPQLYKVQVILKDDEGNPVDDYVLTTGIRTVDQEGGSFRLNGKVSMLNGAQIMGYKGPIEKLATWSRCAPDDWIAKELMMIRRMNGNLLRVHAHAWEFPARGINDPRYAEMADQLGVMLLWCPTAWIRTGRGWGDIDFNGYPKYMRQVYNHPSIVMWEAANHTQSFKARDVMESNLFCEKVHNTLYPVDPSRIISYNSYVRHLHYGNDKGTIDQQGNPIEPSWAWTAPKVTRGNQDSPTGYGKDWSVLRNYPGEYRQSFLDSKDRAYFNFEHQESIGQPNWNLVRGRPWYKLHSYEWSYDEGCIGRRLSLDEWQESQAWQAFGAWEAMKKMRYLDYDGFSWCCLHGGANSITYKKPLIDFLDHAKLAYWANKMVFQHTVAGSHDVDVVYGPDDKIKPVIMHLGEDTKVSLTVKVCNLEGKTVAEKTYNNIALEGGRTATTLDAFMPQLSEEYYVIRYEVMTE